MLSKPLHFGNFISFSFSWLFHSFFSFVIATFLPILGIFVLNYAAHAFLGLPFADASQPQPPRSLCFGGFDFFAEANTATEALENVEAPGHPGFPPISCKSPVGTLVEWSLHFGREILGWDLILLRNRLMTSRERDLLWESMLWKKTEEPTNLRFNSKSCAFFEQCLFFFYWQPIGNPIFPAPLSWFPTWVNPYATR